MEFKVPGMQQNQVNITPASAFANHTNSYHQLAMEGEDRWIYREVIERKLEMEMIREKIIAEEVERFQVLEEQVRMELMLGRQMMAMNIDVLFLLTFTGNLYDPILPELKLKPQPLMAAGGSSELKSCNSKKKMEWRCSICKIRASCERGLIEHLAGRKHHVKAASIVITNNKMEWSCPICEFSASCERDLQNHLAGKKHQSKLAARNSSECVPEKVNLAKRMDWRCPICEVCVTSEIDLQRHLTGKKHTKARVKNR